MNSFRRPLKALGLGAGLVFAAFAAMTFMHAWSMTHYAPSTARTTRAAELTPWSRLAVIASGGTVRRQINKRTPQDVGLDFETRHFRGALGLQLEAWRIPARGNVPVPAVLMFPGYGGSKDTLLAAAQQFAGFGMEVWMIDPHGVGGSEGATTSIGWHEAKDVAAAFREFRATSAAPCLLYGTSMGAVSILRAADQGWVNPDAVILECPFDRFTHAVAAGYERFAFPSGLFGPATAFWVGVQQGFNAFAHNPVDYVRHLRCPALLLQGEFDDTIGRTHVRAVGEHLNASSTFAFLPGAGHAFLVTRSPEPWRANVGAFLRSHFTLPPTLTSNP